MNTRKVFCILMISLLCLSECTNGASENTNKTPKVEQCNVTKKDCTNGASENTNKTPKNEQCNVTKQQKENVDVYVCTGKKSKRYHKTQFCRGLKACKHDIKKYKLSEVPDKYTPCKICNPPQK